MQRSTFMLKIIDTNIEFDTNVQQFVYPKLVFIVKYVINIQLRGQKKFSLEHLHMCCLF